MVREGFEDSSFLISGFMRSLANRLTRQLKKGIGRISKKYNELFKKLLRTIRKSSMNFCKNFCEPLRQALRNKPVGFT